ncbi:MAG: hypothetical protein ACYC5Y_09280 [Symbiobacteriia bacterium]
MPRALADLYQMIVSEPPYAGIGREGLEERWLADCFELAELAVAGWASGRG